MSALIIVLTIFGLVILYLFIGAFMSIPIEWFIRQINGNGYVTIDNEDRWKFILFWPFLIVIGIIGSLGYFPFWLSKKLAEKVFKDKES